MTGSDRIIDHTTFGELQWKRDPFAPTFFVLPPGFQERAHLLPDDLVEVLKDIHALQCVQDLPGYSCQNPIEMLRVDNHQASIGSRLVGLPKLSPIMEACHLAAYLSACMLCCKVWRHSAIPVRDFYPRNHPSPKMRQDLSATLILTQEGGRLKGLRVKAPIAQPTRVG